MNELKCRTCTACNFVKGNGNPNRYYCEEIAEGGPRKMICRTKRHSEEFTIKRTPKWCPRNNKESDNNGKI